MNRDTLLLLSKDDLIGLILAQHGQIEALSARITELEARLGAPPKTPDNSSLPPRRGRSRTFPIARNIPAAGAPASAVRWPNAPTGSSRQRSPPVRTVPMRSALPTRPTSRRLFKAMRRDRDDLFRFITRRDVPATNNACERALRPSVIFRNVTGGFRAEWEAKVYAAAATVIATGRLQGLTALAAVRAALAGEPIIRDG